MLTNWQMFGYVVANDSWLFRNQYKARIGYPRLFEFVKSFYFFPSSTFWSVFGSAKNSVWIIRMMNLENPAYSESNNFIVFTLSMEIIFVSVADFFFGANVEFKYTSPRFILNSLSTAFFCLGLSACAFVSDCKNTRSKCE